MRVRIHVRPGAARPRVGGDHAGALVVCVHERAVDGAATAAALRALATSLHLRSSDVQLVTGHTSRSKIVDIPDTAAAAFADLRDSTS